MRGEYMKTSYGRSFCGDKSSNIHVNQIMQNTLNSGFYRTSPFNGGEEETLTGESVANSFDASERPWARIAAQNLTKSHTQDMQHRRSPT